MSKNGELVQSIPDAIAKILETYTGKIESGSRNLRRIGQEQGPGGPP